jgi:thioredoxin-related protein
MSDFKYLKIQDNSEKIQWISLDEASKLAEKTGKKIIVDVYTHWCGWCKIMDQKTFSNSDVIKYINSKYLAVKLNAETKDSLIYKGIKFGFNPEKRANQLAYLLLNGKMSYPTTVILNEKSEILTPITGFVEPQIMLKVLKYYGENYYTTMKWEEFEKTN